MHWLAVLLSMGKGAFRIIWLRGGFEQKLQQHRADDESRASTHGDQAQEQASRATALRSLRGTWLRV
jgi:hypothetical protein